MLLTCLDYDSSHLVECEHQFHSGSAGTGVLLKCDRLDLFKGPNQRECVDWMCWPRCVRIWMENKIDKESFFCYCLVALNNTPASGMVIFVYLT